jgi:hypothetical protein
MKRERTFSTFSPALSDDPAAAASSGDGFRFLSLSSRLSRASLAASVSFDRASSLTFASFSSTFSRSLSWICSDQREKISYNSYEAS